MYGADFGPNSATTVYSWDAFSGEILVNVSSSANVASVRAGGPANRIFLTIWDGGGKDTYDVSNYIRQCSDRSDAPEVSLGSHRDKLARKTDNELDVNGNVYNAFQYQGRCAMSHRERQGRKRQ